VVYLRRAIMDDVKMLQQKLLAIIGPLARNSCLNKHKYREALVDSLDIIEGINTSVKLFHKAEDLNPKQKTGCEEFIDCYV